MVQDSFLLSRDLTGIYPHIATKPIVVSVGSVLLTMEKVSEVVIS